MTAKMKNKMLVSKEGEWKKILKRKENKKERFIFNFLNSHDLYFFNQDLSFRKAVSSNCVNFADGFMVSSYLTLKNLKKIERLSGPDFTKNFFMKEDLSDKKKHFFIGFEEKDLEELSKKFPYLNKKNLFCYNPP